MQDKSDSEVSSDIERRMLDFAEYLKKEERIPTTEVSSSIGVNASYFSTLKKRLDSKKEIQRHPSALVIQRLCIKYGLNSEWVLFGKGPMISRTPQLSDELKGKDLSELIGMAERSLSNLKKGNGRLRVTGLPPDLKIRLLELLLKDAETDL